MVEQGQEAHSNPTESTIPLEKPNYLSSFQQLGRQIYFYEPARDNEKATIANGGVEDVARPDLIIVCSWMAASARHVSKYTTPYMSRYKSIPMLLVRSSQFDVLFKPERNQVEEIKPAVTAVQSVLKSLQNKPRVLLHVFSNGGCWSASTLASAYRKATGGLNLPVTALVMDSCPSTPSIRLSHHALLTALPKNVLLRFVGSFFIWMMLFLVRALNRLKITENIIVLIRKVLNDPAGPFIRGGIPRVYICSKGDKMVPISDVKRHAEEAEMVMRRFGLSEDEVRRRVGFEEFHGSPHVGHLMVDAERYWNIVKAVWVKAMRIQARIELDA